MTAEPSSFESAELGRTVEKKDYESVVPDLRVGLVNAQFDLRRSNFAVLLLVGGDDRLGVRDLLGEMIDWMDERYLRIHLFGERTEEEQARPPAWRYWNAMPRDGETAVFIDSWVAHTIGERALGTLSAKKFDRRCEMIRHLEQALVDDGTLLVKVWLHVPKKEVKRRLDKHAKNDAKSWRIDARDREIYERYDETLPIAQRYVDATDTPACPWLVVESTDRHYRNLTVAHEILKRLTERLAEPLAPSRSEAAALVESKASKKRTRSVLDTLDLSSSLSEERYEAKLEQQSECLAHLTRRARRKSVATVLVFEGWDAAGKGGTIRRLARVVDLENQHMVAISAPTPEELAHHYLWRFWRELPRDGIVTFYDRSWYGRVLVERVEKFATTSEWSRAYDEINDFEAHLVEHGIVLVKFWLHISHEEQMRRFEAREETPYKKYKITSEDYRNRAKRPEYEAAVDDMVARTSTKIAPWHLVPADDKKFARIRVFETVCEALQDRL
jgi:polyphosphate:AMP phosphotransferase